MKDLVAIAVATTLGFAGVAAAKPPSETILHSFNGSKAGLNPWAGLIMDKQGALYGTTTSSGPRACGTAFRVKPAKTGKPWGFSVLHVFTKGTGDGCFPLGGLVADPGGTLYGTTTRGGSGAKDGGTVFTLTPPAAGSKEWTETIIYSFTTLAQPTALIRDASGVLYGTASSGGPTASGSVFELTPPTGGQTNWTETELYGFQGGVDGQDPVGAVVEDSTGALYGTTYLGGAVNICQNNLGCGTVFKLTPPAAGQTAWTKTTFLTFTGVDANGGPGGANPFAGLIVDKSGALYGTTEYGGDDDADGGVGVVFKLSPPAAGQTSWTESVIHSFQGTDGAVPADSLIMTHSGAIFGTTYAGGSSCCGTVFKLAPPAAGQTAWKELVLLSFSRTVPDGFWPYGGLVRDAAGNLFGTTSFGNATQADYGSGTVFEVAP